MLLPARRRAGGALVLLRRLNQSLKSRRRERGFAKCDENGVANAFIERRCIIGGSIIAPREFATESEKGKTIHGYTRFTLEYPP